MRPAGLVGRQAGSYGFAVGIKNLKFGILKRVAGDGIYLLDADHSFRPVEDVGIDVLSRLQFDSDEGIFIDVANRRFGFDDFVNAWFHSLC